MKAMQRLLIILSILLVPLGIHANKVFVMPVNPVLVFETTQGTFEVTLKPELAPKACENMIRLANKGYYNGTTFHRIIPGFMLQGGDPQGTGMGGKSIWEKNFKDETSSKLTFSKRGILAMANRGPNTNGSQFFVTTAATTWLNGKHTIFGEVTSGYGVVKKIEKLGTPSGNPKTVQKINKVFLKKPLP